MLHRSAHLTKYDGGMTLRDIIAVGNNLDRKYVE